MATDANIKFLTIVAAQKQQLAVGTEKSTTKRSAATVNQVYTRTKTAPFETENT